MKSLEEIKTYIGLMMLDLRGNWGFEYKDRMEYVRDYLQELLNNHDITDQERIEIEEDLALTNEEIEEPEDGRIFRDGANFYGYSSKEGLTFDNLKELNDDMTYPDHHIPNYDEFIQELNESNNIGR